MSYAHQAPRRGLPGWAFWTLFAIAIPIHLVKRAVEGIQKLLRR